MIALFKRRRRRIEAPSPCPAWHRHDSRNNAAANMLSGLGGFFKGLKVFGAYRLAGIVPGRLLINEHVWHEPYAPAIFAKFYAGSLGIKSIQRLSSA